MLGYARVYLDRPWRWLTWAGDRVPPFYIWHQTVITLLVTAVICEVVGRTNLTRGAFGMRPR